MPFRKVNVNVDAGAAQQRYSIRKVSEKSRVRHPEQDDGPTFSPRGRAILAGDAYGLGTLTRAALCT
jgi:hypothetical protein